MQAFFDVSNPKKKLTGKALLYFEDMQSGEAFNVHGAAELLACFMVDGEGKTIEHKRAMQIFEEWTVEQIEEAVAKLQEAFNDKAVPPTNGSESSSPSIMEDALPAG